MEWKAHKPAYGLPYVMSADGQLCIAERVFNGNEDLIAAAPALYAALEAYEAAIQAIYTRNGVLHLVPGMHLFLPHEQARAALLAAKGGK